MNEYPLEIFEVSTSSDESDPVAYVSFGHHDPEAFCEQEILNYDFAPKDVRHEYWRERETGDEDMPIGYHPVDADAEDAKPVTVVDA